VQHHYHFANKLYNIAKFSKPFIDSANQSSTIFNELDWKAVSFPNRWLLTRLQHARSSWKHDSAEFNMARATQNLISLVQNDISDVYIELMKRRLPNCAVSQRVLAFCLRQAIVMLYPAMPHLSSHLHARLFSSESVASKGQTILGQTLIPCEVDSTSVLSLMESLLGVIRGGRKLSGTQSVDRSILYFQSTSDSTEVQEVVKSLEKELLRLVKFQEISCNHVPNEILETMEQVILSPGLMLCARKTSCYESSQSSEREWLKLTREVSKLEKMMANPKYLATVSPELRAKSEEKLSTFQLRLGQLDLERISVASRK
jgi:valyl-tRNA synthetase